ncbi:MAG: rubrerythrin [Chloroflexota bacterium]|nr:MAG: rubrerythrin [Chloroflexota bacterium]
MAAFTAAEGLEMAMEIEKNGEVFYNGIAAKSTDPELKVLFEELALQERGHHQVFQKMLGNVTPAMGLPATEYDQYETYLKVALENALFAGPDKALSLAKEAKDGETALRTAMGFEKDTLLFFYDLRDLVSKADQEAITKIILEEKKHIRRLMDML